MRGDHSGTTYKGDSMRRWATLIFFLLVGASRAADPPVLTARLSRPDRQLERLIALFEGAKANDPAAALAAWKRANHDPQAAYPKSVEAVIALLNPGMVRELRTLDGAELVLIPDPAGVRWSAIVPEDDGTFAALATAMALSGGGPEPPIGAATIDRLGPPGSAQIAQAGAAVVVSARRDDLEAALGRLPLPPLDAPCGLRIQLDPEALGGSGPLPRRRVAEALRALGYTGIRGDAGLDGETLAIIVQGRHAGPPIAPKPLDPSWLDWVPSDGRVVAAVGVANDPTPAAWDALLAAADRVEKVDPARAEYAPIRTRLGILALAAGVRPEADLWPHLLGLTAFATAEPTGTIDGGFLALHMDTEPAAARIADRLLPRLAVSARLVPRDAPAEPDGTRPLGRLSGRPLRVARRGATVGISWGDGVLASALAAHDRPGQSAGAAIRSAWPARPPQRAGALWPGHLPGIAAESPPKAGLRESLPILWWGDSDDVTSRDEVRWSGLKGVVRRTLDRLPMDPPPDRAGLIAPKSR